MITGMLKKDLTAVLKVRHHELLSDVPPKLGGGDAAPDPHELLEAALAACTIITVQMYAVRKQWPLESTDVVVKVETEGPAGAVISRKISFRGDLSEEQRQRLLDISNRCPIHRLLTGKIEVRTELAVDSVLPPQPGS